MALFLHLSVESHVGNLMTVGKRVGETTAQRIGDTDTCHNSQISA